MPTNDEIINDVELLKETFVHRNGEANIGRQMATLQQYLGAVDSLATPIQESEKQKLERINQEILAKIAADEVTYAANAAVMAQLSQQKIKANEIAAAIQAKSDNGAAPVTPVPTVLEQVDPAAADPDAAHSKDTGVKTADGAPLKYDPKHENLVGTDAHGHTKTIAEILMAAWTDYRAQPLKHYFARIGFVLGSIVNNMRCEVMIRYYASRGQKNGVMSATAQENINKYRAQQVSSAAIGHSLLKAVSSSPEKWFDADNPLEAVFARKEAARLNGRINKDNVTNDIMAVRYRTRDIQSEKDREAATQLARTSGWEDALREREEILDALGIARPASPIKDAVDANKLDRLSDDYMNGPNGLKAYSKALLKIEYENKGKISVERSKRRNEAAIARARAAKTAMANAPGKAWTGTKNTASSGYESTKSALSSAKSMVGSGLSSTLEVGKVATIGTAATLTTLGRPLYLFGEATVNRAAALRKSVFGSSDPSALPLRGRSSGRPFARGMARVEVESPLLSSRAPAPVIRVDVEEAPRDERGRGASIDGLI